MPKVPKAELPKTVLIVEDSTDFSSLLKFIVEDDGFVGVQFPVNAEDILSAVKEHKPAVVLMDLALRKKGGMQFIEELKSDPATKHVPIIVITGRDLGQKEVLDLAMRGIKYMRKGRVEMHEIRREIRTAAHAKGPAAAAGEQS
jgi:DNA-binding response OmpR family regulator